MDSQTLGAVATIALVLVTGIGLTFAALAPYRVAQRQRKDAEPAIVVEAQDFWKVTYGPVQELAVRPGGADGMAGALVLGEPSWPPPGKASNSGELSCARRILVRFTNVGATAAIGLRVPLRLSFSYLAKDAATAGNPETLGLRHETITHSVEVRIPSLPPGEHLTFFVNETGEPINIESTGEAFDRPLPLQSERRLAALSPIPIVLPASP